MTVGSAVFEKPPTSIQVRAFLGMLFRKAKPKHLVCDKGT